MSYAKANPDYRKPIHFAGLSWWPWARKARTRVPVPSLDTQRPLQQPTLRLAEAHNISHRIYCDF